MSLLTLILLIVVLGFVMYLINRHVPMEPMIKNVLNIVVVIVLVLWLLRASGLFSSLNQPVLP